MTQPISQQALESYLWGAATLLRGVIDAGDYKQFIFPLLFYKRLCDVYEEEFQQAMEISGGDIDYAAFAEIHRFLISPGARWQTVRDQATNLGAAIQRAMREVEQDNPSQLYGIFGDAQWSNKDRLTDATMRDLIEHFSSLTLSIANVPEDELGQAYEYLIKKFADDSGHTAAEFYTNRTVVHLMTLLLEPQPGESIYDPTCGSGGMLLSAVAELKRQGREYRSVKLYGQERNLMTSAIARMNLFLHGIEDFYIERGDTLAEPKFISGDQLRRFNVILANPPYSIKQWDRKKWESDPYGRNNYGTPPQGRADYAFFQHILTSLEPENGRCAILFPHGVLFRDEEQHMRTKLVAADQVECVLGLGPNLFYNSPMEACVVICRTNKPPERQGKVLFINAVNEVTRERAQSFLQPHHIKRIVEVYHDWAEVEGFSRIATLEEIAAKQSNLSIPLYVRPAAATGSNKASKQQLVEAIASWQASSQELRLSMDSLFLTLEQTFAARQLKIETEAESVSTIELEKSAPAVDTRQTDNVLVWLSAFPVKELVKRKWIAERIRPEDQLAELVNYFGVASPAQLAAYDTEIVPAYRRSNAFTIDEGAIKAWLRRGQIKAEQIQCQPFNAVRFRQELDYIRTLTRKEPEVIRAELIERCASAGVAVVIVPELPKTRVFGATRWLTPEKVVMQLSLRYKTDNHFWFTFFHEAGHILLDSKDGSYCNDASEMRVSKEGEANRFANNTLIPYEKLQEFLENKRPFYISKQEVQDFADQLGIAPSIVVARLQFEKYARRNNLNGFKRKLDWSD